MPSVLVLATACTGEPDAAPTIPTSSTSGAVVTEPARPTSTTPMTTTATFMPVTPEEPRPLPVPEQTSESAVAFLQWWVTVLNHAATSGDVQQLRETSLPGCVFCQNRIENVEQAYAAGDRFEFAEETSVSEPKPGAVDLNAYVVIDFEISSPASRRLSASGDVLADFPALPATAYVAGIQWQDGGWRISEIATAQ